jgi:hypothetical protein
MDTQLLNPIALAPGDHKSNLNSEEYDGNDFMEKFIFSKFG